MKTIDVSTSRASRAPVRHALALAASAVLAAAALAMPAHAAGHGGMGPHGTQMQHADGHGHGHGAGHDHHGRHQGRHAVRGEQGQFLSDRALDRIQATPEQKTRIREILMTARKDLQAQRSEGQSLREQSMKLFSQPEIDPKAIEDLRAQVMARRDAASKRMTQAMVEASQVLTPAQRQQLAQHGDSRREMMRRHHEERRALGTPRS